MSSVLPLAEGVQPVTGLDFHELRLHRHADADPRQRHADEVTDEPHALFQLDQRHRQRVVESRQLRLVHDDEAVYDATAAGLERVPLACLAARTGGPRRVMQVAAARTAADQQALLAESLPEERRVARDRGARMRRTLRHLRCRRARLFPLRRPELEDAEAHPPDQLALLIVKLVAVIE